MKMINWRKLRYNLSVCLCAFLTYQPSLGWTEECYQQTETCCTPDPCCQTPWWDTASGRLVVVIGGAALIGAAAGAAVSNSGHHGKDGSHGTPGIKGIKGSRGSSGSAIPGLRGADGAPGIGFTEDANGSLAASGQLTIDSLDVTPIIAPSGTRVIPYIIYPNGNRELGFIVDLSGQDLNSITIPLFAMASPPLAYGTYYIGVQFETPNGPSDNFDLSLTDWEVMTTRSTSPADSIVTLLSSLTTQVATNSGSVAQIAIPFAFTPTAIP